MIIWFYVKYPLFLVSGFRFQVSGVRNESQMAVISFAIISAGYGGFRGRNVLAEY